MWQSMRIRTKLLLCNVLFALFVVALASIATWQLWQLAAQSGNSDIGGKLWLIWGSVVVFCCCGLYVGLLVTGDVCNPLKRGMEFVKALAAGDFEARWEEGGNSEPAAMARALNEAIDFMLEQAFQYRDILNSLPNPLATLDKERNFIFVNAAAEQMFGMLCKDLVGKPCSTWNASICNTEHCALECHLRGIKEVTFHQPGMGTLKAAVVPLHNRRGELSG